MITVSLAVDNQSKSPTTPPSELTVGAQHVVMVLPPTEDTQQRTVTTVSLETGCKFKLSTKPTTCLPTPKLQCWILLMYVL